MAGGRRRVHDHGDPSSLVAVQWALGTAPADPAAGAHRLMLAILVDSVRLVRRHHDRATRAWIASEDERWVFSFRHICAELHLSPDRIRRALRTARLHGHGTHMRCARQSQKLSHRAVG